MTDSTDRRVLLIHHAAEGVAPLIKGCAQTLVPAPAERVGASRAAPVKPIAFFGPGIVARWRDALALNPHEEKLHALAQLSTLSAAECESEVVPTLERLAPDASAEDRAMTVEYIKAIPLAVRRTLVTDPQTGQV